MTENTIPFQPVETSVETLIRAAAQVDITAEDALRLAEAASYAAEALCSLAEYRARQRALRGNGH